MDNPSKRKDTSSLMRDIDNIVHRRHNQSHGCNGIGFHFAETPQSEPAQSKGPDAGENTFKNDARATIDRRATELELETTKTQLVALRNNFERYKADTESALDFARSQAESKIEEVHAIRQREQKLTMALSELRNTQEKQQETAACLERGLRERLKAGEVRIHDAEAGREEAESRACNAERSAHVSRCAERELEREASRLRHENDSLLRNILRLQDELSVTQRELEITLQHQEKDQSITKAIQHSDTGMAALVQECRALREENSRLHKTALDEKTGSERLKHRAEKKLATAMHDTSRLQTRLEKLSDELRNAKHLITSLEAEADKTAEAHESAISALKHAAAEAQRRAVEELKSAERRWAERGEVAVENAVSAYQRRIQELELQLHCTTRADGTTVASLGSVPGGLGSSTCILEYIPRAEHLRILEARTAARAAEAEAAVAAVKQAADREAAVQLRSVTAQLEAARQEAKISVTTLEEHKAAASKARQEHEALQTKCNELQQLADTAGRECAQLNTRIEELQRQVEHQQVQHVKAITAASDALQRESQSASTALESLKRAEAASKEARQTADRYQDELQELKATLDELKAHYRGETAERQGIERDLRDVLSDRDHLQRVATTIAQRSAELQQRAAFAEAEKVKSHALVSQLKSELDRLQATAAAVREELATTKSSEAAIMAHCQEQQAACQRANDEITALQTRCRALEQQCHVLQDQYAVDMEAIERAAREQVQSVQSQAEETIAGLRRTSAMLQGRLSVFDNNGNPGDKWTGSSLAAEVDEAKARLAAQAAHAEQLEKKEETVGQLLKALLGAAAQKVEDGPTTGGGEAAMQQAKIST